VISKKEKIDKYNEVEKVYFEPIIGCNHPIISSGATPIRSAERAPNEKGCTARLKTEIILSLYSNNKFNYSLGGYSHRER
jgi:hypothetical protein